MATTGEAPRPEDFGITEDDLASAPCLFLAGHRAEVLIGAYVAAGAGIFGVILNAGSSVPAAVLFSIITLAAASVLLLPLLTAALCASENAEERWLCGRFPKLGACLAYRRAAAEHARTAPSRRPDAERPRAWWTSATPEAFAEAVGAELTRRLQVEKVSVDRERTGVDFVIDGERGSVLVRCEAGGGPVSAAVGRELAAALTDLGGGKAVLVTAASVSPELAGYLAGRAISTVAPWQLEDIRRNEESGIPTPACR